MPLVQTRGAASAQGFGEFAQAATAVNYIEEVFSCFLYTGTGSSQTITNNIDLSTKGGLTWIKGRSGATGHRLTDTARGVTKSLASNSTAAEATESTGLTAFGTTGFTIGADADYNTSAATYASWTFREQPKFFDIVTWTGNGTTQAISHNLGSTPGCVMVKCRSTAGTDWFVWHRALTFGYWLRLNTTGAQSNANSEFNFGNNTIAVDPTSTVLTVGNNTDLNGSGRTYVAYIFAHDAGGFGLAGTDNVISCGTYTGNGSATGPVVTLGYEPQWVMVKRTDTTSNWTIFDTMRGMSQTTANLLYPNLSDDEGIGTQGWVVPNATGFQLAITQSSVNASGGTYIYIAIRRGPMKVPTDATKVFSPVLYTGTGSAPQTVTASGMNPADTLWHLRRVGDFQTRWDRLRGGGYLSQDSSAENTTQSLAFDLMTGSKYLTYDSSWGSSSISDDMLNYYLGRAPSFFDVVCYVGNGISGRTVTHNLAATPELMIVRQRTGGDWYVYASGIGATKFLVLNATDAAVIDAALWNNTAPTSSVFTLGDATGVNRSATNFVAYLFATCAGVSKVGSYTGNGSTQTINCGFTGGARFVMIKKTSATSSWFVWDTSRGMVSGTDPRLFLNNPDGESNNDWVYTASTGFQIVTSNTNVNASGSSYIFLAIA